MGGKRGIFNNIDWMLILCYLTLILIGWCNIYASVHSSEPASIFDFESRSGKQFIWMMTALAIAVFILFVFNPRLYQGLSFPIYVCTVLLLISVIFLGTEVKGSRSWFEFGAVKFQPAEISKIATSLFLATVMSQFGFKLSRFRNFIAVAAIIAIPMLIIILQSETGSALVYVGFVFMLYREGLSGWLLFIIAMAITSFIMTLMVSPFASILMLIIVISICNAVYMGEIKRWLTIYLPVFIVLGILPFATQWIASVKPLYILLGCIAIALPIIAYRAFRKRSMFTLMSIISAIAGIMFIFSADFIFNDVLQPHQRKRIEVLLGMKEDPSGVGYNVNQSMIAIGSGGLTGKGFLKGTQTTYGFVPEQSTDFIFCTIGEEWGFIGSSFVILLYVFMIWRIINRAEKSRDAFTRIYGYCAASCIFMHLFINIGMTIGLMPVIGIPLPFISYGGSSLWAFTTLLFIFLALDRNERRYFG